MTHKPGDLLETERRATVDVVRVVVPQIIAIEESDRILADLTTLIEGNESPRIVLDLEVLNHVSSTMLSTLVELRALVSDRGGRIAFAQLSPRLKDLFEMVRITTMFESYLSTEAAVAALLD